MNAKISLHTINFLIPTPHFNKRQICPSFVPYYRVFSTSGAEKICMPNFQANRPCLTCQLQKIGEKPQHSNGKVLLIYMTTETQKVTASWQQGKNFGG